MKNPLLSAALLLAPLLLSQCAKTDEPVPPAKLIPRNQMVSLLVDMHLMESRVEASRLPPDSARVLYRQQVQQVYWRYSTDAPTFQQSMRYYATHGKDLEEIYTTVVDSLTARQMHMTTGATPAAAPAEKKW